MKTVSNDRGFVYSSQLPENSRYKIHNNIYLRQHYIPAFKSPINVSYNFGPQISSVNYPQ